MSQVNNSLRYILLGQYDMSYISNSNAHTKISFSYKLMNAWTLCTEQWSNILVDIQSRYCSMHLIVFL